MATLSPTSNKEQIFYQTYTPYIPAYMSGYTGHIPHVQKEEFINRIVHTKHIWDLYHLLMQKINSEKVMEKKLLNL
jgi:hypothetical protein